MFKVRKIFDCTEMPKDIYEAFKKVVIGGEYFNGIHKSIEVGYYDFDNLVEDWLMANGADLHETVLVKFWW